MIQTGRKVQVFGMYSFELHPDEVRAIDGIMARKHPDELRVLNIMMSAAQAASNNGHGPRSSVVKIDEVLPKATNTNTRHRRPSKRAESHRIMSPGSARA